MRHRLGLVIIILVVVAALIGLNAAGNIQLDKPEESESSPLRSSYNSGPTGTRAIYQLLEESGIKVSRWRDKYATLDDLAKGSTLVIIGPFNFGQSLPSEESAQLHQWIARGGRALIISRYPFDQFGDSAIRVNFETQPPPQSTKTDQNNQAANQAGQAGQASQTSQTSQINQASQDDRIINPKSDDLIAQPTDLTRDVQGLAFSVFAAKMKFVPQADQAQEDASEDSFPAPPPPKPVAEPESTLTPPPSTETSPTPTMAPNNSDKSSTESNEPKGNDDSKDEGSDMSETLNSPVIHLGDKDGAVLADFDYGEGRVIFLSDPFVMANNGIARGANLKLVMNILHSLGASEHGVIFDEYHHGYSVRSNPLVDYFRGTPLSWLIVQGAFLCLMMLYTYGWRFGRPLPLPQVDRNSPLEFVGSMANLQQAAQARDLAIENIYPRFKSQLCRRLGLSSQAREDEMIESLSRRGLPIPEAEIRQIINQGEAVLKGAQIDNNQMINLVAGMRRILAGVKR